MNFVTTFLQNSWQRLNLDRYGSSSEVSCVMLTPGFKASSHLIVFVLLKGSTKPVLVTKLPRISGDHDRLDREAANLSQIHSIRQTGFESIPRLLAYEDFKSHRLLVETMLQGQIMRPAVIRRNEANCVESAMNWLEEIHLETAVSKRITGAGFSSLVEDRLNCFEESLPLTAEEHKGIKLTRALIEPLRGSVFPLVFEHGDFSSPNLLIDMSGRLGVVDWELAEPAGLPLADLFFFLTFVAFAKNRATQLKEQLWAFRQAFFRPDGWTRPYLLQFCERLKLPPEWLLPLFVLSWGRYVANMVIRLRGTTTHGKNTLSQQTVEWLRTNRYYRIWLHTIEWINDFIIKTP